MLKRIVSGMILTLLLIGMLTLAFNTSQACMQSETVLYVYPSTTEIQVNSDFTVDVTVADVVDLSAYECYLGYNTTILDVLTISVWPPFEDSTGVNETGGYLSVIALLPPDYPKVSGSAVLFSITFRTTSPGSSILHLYNSILIGSEIKPIPHTTIDGFVTAYSIMQLKTNKYIYALGENVTITLKNISNETVEIGGYPAWQVFTYPEEEPVYPKIFAFLLWSLSPGENDTYTWNQYSEFNESFCNPGLYVVRDTHGWGLSSYFIITILGDVDGNFKVDMADIGWICYSYGATPSHPRWNPNTDVTNNNFIDMTDIGIACLHYGEKYP